MDKIVKVVTRFAPSPTGNLHLGGARTALFNWLFARRHGGKFLLRIEDTDKDRSSEAITQSIIENLEWLGITQDESIVIQSSKIERHIEVTQQLLSLQKAYYCYCQEDMTKRQRAENEFGGICHKYICPWREKSPETSIPVGVAGVVRLKTPKSTKMFFSDGVYGEISMDSEKIDDIVILRSNGTPTYPLAVVVDDHDMGITHIIRGSDHMVNTHKQIILAQSLGWDSPKFFHVPLIHDENGNKLSKRNRVPGIHEYKEQGFLPEAVCNYLLRMGWSHQDKEIISMKEAIDIFSTEDIGTSPACLDNKKLLFLNHHYMKQLAPYDTLNTLLPFLKKEVSSKISEEKISCLSMGIPRLLERAKTLVELAKESLFYVQDIPITSSDEAVEFISLNKVLLPKLVSSMSETTEWKKEVLTLRVKELSTVEKVEISDIYRVLRAAITGKLVSPNICEVMEILGQKECLARLVFHTNVLFK